MATTISSTVRRFPTLPYEAMKDAVLGKEYTLALTFIGERRAKVLNVSYREATYVPNVLSFPLSDTAGEIYICPRVAAREAKKFSLSKNGYIGFLFIHGLLHLKGHLHGDTMDKAEKRYVARFNLK
ncbi:MAG TPA: rRNA maturation RNase YbeY [Candidatus Paceibacterota bacterium]|nr:rRNA maturation RNase YbeY [Candidatus Paceibacterota bacterium]